MNYISTFTNSLTGAALDYAVCTATGLLAAYPMTKKSFLRKWQDGKVPALHPSTLWGMGGSIMGVENICAKPHISPRDGKHFYACRWNEAGDIGSFSSIGSTQLIAAMRCYVQSKLGATVDIPEELL